ncbi:carbohydrate kinase family protein [Candidatus Woesearchaeota archaeon]|nr:carbohydrate kinase family protein [Candidatus Woesearchaeota archaeon]
MYDVITVGSNTLDIFAHTEKSQVIDIRTSDKRTEFISYPVGEKILVTRMLHNFGGNGANAAAAFAKMKLKTGYVGKVGRDTTGEQILSSFKRNKVSFLGAKGAESGTSIILDAMEEDRTILTFKGCNNDLEDKDLWIGRLNARWYYVSSMMGASLKTMQKIVWHAKEKKRKIAFNPSQTIIDHEKEAALSILRMSHVLVLNKEEAEELIGESTVDENLQKIVSMGPEYAVITDGKNGATAFHDGTFYHVDAHSGIKIVETTGAGDAFAATFTAGLIIKKPVSFALKMAINQAENVIQTHGAQNGLMDAKELLASATHDKRPVTERKTR